MNRKAYRNIINLSIIRFSKWFMLYMPIIKLYYEQNGLNNFQLLGLHAVHSITICMFELPSGYAADMWGRKTTILTGTVLNLAGFIVYSVSSGFWGFLIAELSLGLAVSLVSGSDSAMLYDTLAETGMKKQYLKYEGRLSALGNFSESFAGMAVSGIMFLGVSNLRYAYVAQTMVAFIGIPAAVLLTEPEVHVKPLMRNVQSIIRVIKEHIIDNKALRYIILYSSIIGFSTLIMAWFAQIYFFEVHLDEKLYGVLWTALNMTVGLGSLIVYKYESRFGRRKSTLLILIFIAVMFFINGLLMEVWAISFLFLFYFIRGTATPLLKEYINRIAPSDIRATVLSVRSFLIRIFYSALGPFFGWISDTIDLATALIMTGITVLITGSVTLFLLYKTFPATGQNHENNGQS